MSDFLGAVTDKTTQQINKPQNYRSENRIINIFTIE